jgi:tRNA threonylcarbamoyladenosine biosynthesis protein TsaB
LVLPPSREHLENLALIIMELTGRIGIRLGEVDGFGVATGPGSFSGIRVGLAMVKGMALALGKPVAGVSTLEVLAWEALQEGQAGIPVIDARRGQIYTAFYRKGSYGLEQIREAQVVGPDEFAELASRACERVIICGDHTMDHLVGVTGNLSRSPVEIPSPSVCANLAQARIQSGEAAGVHGVAPLYVRRSDAEEKRDQRRRE